MSTEIAIFPLRFSPHRQHLSSLPQGTLKRKFGSLAPPGGQGAFHYPSPPMSNPPSPHRRFQELPHTTAVELATTSTVRQEPVTSIADLPASLPPTGLDLPPPHSGPAAGLPPLTGSYAATNTSPGPRIGIAQASHGVAQASSTVAPVAGPSAVRTGRKSKAHVASACVNCKRAHLSCDVQRPCARCVASGKQETCFDVQHKKRGRPRLREESEFRVEQMLPQATSHAPTAAAVGPSTPRQIAGTRHRRTESLRSLRSQASDNSPGTGGSAASFVAPPPLQSPFMYQRPPLPPPALLPAEIPTAFLDLELNILRANAPFQEIMSGGAEIRGVNIRDLAIPADGQPLEVVRNHLQAERNSREYSYTAPTLTTSPDPLHGVHEADIDRLTQTFDDRTYSWRRQSPGSLESFPARVRLGKANSYFVAVTLPTFRPTSVLPPPPPLRPIMPAPTFARPPASVAYEDVYHQGPQSSHSAPPAAHYAWLPTMAPPSAQPPQAQSGLARTYPPPRPTVPYQPQPAYSPYPPFLPPTTPRLPAAEPPTETTPFTPRSVVREMGPLSGPSRQLPPLGSSPPASAGAAGTAAAGMRAQPAAEEEDEDSPRKRRRMGIGDVLQGP